jgi:hypothetical protein
MRRRTVLTAIVGGTLSTAGCTGVPDTAAGGSTATETTETTTASLPNSCPTTQGLDVEWPEELDAATVESFVEAYEAAYYREVVVDYEPESTLDSYGLNGGTDDATRVGDGWQVSYNGGGGIYTPTLGLRATTGDPPAGADVVPSSEIEDDLLTGLLEDAVETGEARRHIDTPGEEVDRYVDLLSSLSDDFEPLTGPGDSDSLHVDVDGTVVELTARADSFHGDYGWTAWYYVDEQVVRRTSDEDTSPREGTVLECRRLD